jgi:UDP-N-acetylglucosamine 1-carboxyvinyltransferase
MSTFIIKGGDKLRGEVKIQGAKNEALQVLSAVLLTEDPVWIYNLPDIEDVQKLIELLEILGVEVGRIEASKNNYRFCAKNISKESAFSKEFLEKFKHLRGSLMLVGPLLSRFGQAPMPRPGGDKIGARPVTTHERVLTDLGADMHSEGDFKIFNGNIQQNFAGGERKVIRMKEASVTGTANAILASVVGKGVIQIENAAQEPYIQQLCKMLNKMGAEISEAHIGSSRLLIQRVPFLRGCSHTVLPDFIEIGSFLALAMVAGDGITLKDALHPDLDLGFTLEMFEKIGLEYQKNGRDIYVPSHATGFKIKLPSSGKPTRVIYDQIWPGLSPDLISVMITACVFAEGIVQFEQRMFEDRLNFARELNDMGAQIIRAHTKMVAVYGLGGSGKHLVGKPLDSPDIRAGMALLIAALAAKGESRIGNASQIKRGYENIIPRLIALGANIQEAS